MNVKQKNEIKRKIIHISSIFIPLSFRFLFQNDRSTFFLFLGPLTGIAIFIEIIRLQNRSFKKVFHDLVGILLRKHELNDFTGATYLLTSSAICIAIFPADIAFIALSFLAIGDSLAALIGIPFGRRKIFGSDKSLEGSIACFAGTFIFSIFFINPVVAFFGALAATISEVCKISIDDNLKIPFISGIIMLIVMFFIK